MRQLRKLAQDVWYEVRSRINNREPVFSRPKAAALFARVFQETMRRFPFEVRGLRFDNDWLVFYIKPEDGEALPRILQWMKQVFAQRYNGLEGRIGHIWGDRYGSRIMENDPPEGSTTAVGEAERGSKNRVRPRRENRNSGLHFPLPFSSPPALDPD